MKKFYSLILALTLSISGAAADKYTADNGLKFEIDPATKTAVFNGIDSNVAESLTTLAIPDEVSYNGTSYPVTSVAENACMQNSALTTVTFGKNLKTIGMGAFYGCPNITTLNLNQGLEEICEKAFYDCQKHENLVLPSGLKRIGSYAFWNNYYLTKPIMIPASLESIGDNPFAGSVNIPEFVVPDDNKHFSAIDRVLFSKDGSILYVYPISRKDTSGKIFTRYSCPPSTKKIAVCAFRNDSKLTNVSLNEGLEEIADQAFNVCDLRSLEIPASVKKIGLRAFTSNRNLSSIKVAEGNTAYTVNNGMLFTKDLRELLLGTSVSEVSLPDATEIIDEYAFYRLPRVVKVNLNNVKTVGDAAFYGCPLTDVNFGKALVSIGDRAFMQCTSLKSAVFPPTLREIGETAFALCLQMNELKLNDGLEKLGSCAFIQCLAISEINLPGSLKEIKESVFYTCYGLKKVTCSEGLTEIGETMFYENTALESVTFPSTLKILSQSCFSSCTALKSITFPESLETVGKAAFQNTGLTEVTIPDNCSMIEESAFVYSKLTKFTAGKKLRTIGNSALGANPDLTEINLNEGLKFIGRMAFAQNESLKSIVIPSTVTNMDGLTFMGDNSLEYIENRATNPQQLTEDLFGQDELNLYDKVWLKVPAASVNEYKKANIWKNFRTIVDLNAGISDINGEEAVILEIYDLNGVRHNNLVRGINIVKMSDGSVRKIVSNE